MIYLFADGRIVDRRLPNMELFRQPYALISLEKWQGDEDCKYAVTLSYLHSPPMFRKQGCAAHMVQLVFEFMHHNRIECLPFTDCASEFWLKMRHRYGDHVWLKSGIEGCLRLDPTTPFPAYLND